jgi:transcriptional repressor NrdR
MVCAYCGQNTRVVNSRHQQRGNQVWRRRQCQACQAVFTSLETVEHSLAWAVSRNGRLGPFSSDKLFLSLYRSCQHRPTALEDARSLTNTVIDKLSTYVHDGRIQASDIAKVAGVALSRFDAAASVNYQAFHA